MKTALYILLALFPSFLHKGIRRLMGQKIGRRVKLRVGSLILSSTVEIGRNSKIGPFTYIKSKELRIGERSVIKPLVIIKTMKVDIANYVHIAPTCIITSEFTINSSIVIGDHSRIFPFCWLDTGEGITIGKHVGVGGHTLMFTHGVWPNYVDGGPIGFGPIKIEDNVWLPWRVFILPNVTIGENAVIGGNSLINKDVPANALAAGSPAKTIKQMSYDTTKKKERLLEILEGYASYCEFKTKRSSTLEGNTLAFDNCKIVMNETEGLNKGDLLILLDSEFDVSQIPANSGISILDYDNLTIHLNRNKNSEVTLFVSYLRRYGVRLYNK
jgi:acetyltransferase-like isoleucine patch superfamily enzyme